MLVAQLCRLFATPWTATHQAPLSMRFSRQGYWSELPFPSLGDLLDPATRYTSRYATGHMGFSILVNTLPPRETPSSYSNWPVTSSTSRKGTTQLLDLYSREIDEDVGITQQRWLESWRRPISQTEMGLPEPEPLIYSISQMKSLDFIYF